jgi:hypothetical protein
VVKLIKRLQLDVHTEDIAFEPIRQSLAHLIPHVNSSGDCKNVIELLESPLLCLRNEKEDHH